MSPTGCERCGNTSFEKSHLLPSSAQVTQLHDILRSNNLPPGSVASSFQSVIDQSPLELKRYAAEIQRLEKTLAELKSDLASLESYTNGCRSMFSPLRRLPNELLVEIFDLCSPPGADLISDSTTPEEEEDRVARNYLLQLSQVCSRWHDVVMETPRLWSTIVADTTVWTRMENESSSHTLVDLVRSSLERGGEFPLNVQIAVDPHHHAERWILELLSQHSHRWKNAHIWLHPHSLGVLLGAKGNLPMLDSLTLSSGTDIDYRYADDVFEIAPRLKTVTLIGWPSGGPALPWGQLLHVTYENGESSKFSLATLPLLSPHACCELAVNASTISIPLELQPVTSDASTLLIRFTSQFDPMRTWEILGIILRCLTLPRLTALRFIHRPNAPPPLWNHTHFREFASRSRLRTTLTQLELYVVIQEHELVGSLAALPLLEELRLWDSAGAGGEVITDSLLRQLTWRSGETNLVPRLSTLGLTTTIAFRDNSLMELVTSRADPGRSENGPFVVMVLLYARCRREFSSEFVAQLAELEEGGDLIFALGRI